jgi:large subunit ribosomal protein L24
LAKTKKPGKQRKSLFKAPYHMRNKIMSVKLIPDLAVEYGCKRLPVRKGDNVVVISGEFKDTEGKVLKINRKDYTLTVKELVVEKADGSEFNVPIHYSNVMIVKLEKDKWRDKIIERRALKED